MIWSAHMPCYCYIKSFESFLEKVMCGSLAFLIVSLCEYCFFGLCVDYPYFMVVNWWLFVLFRSYSNGRPEHAAFSWRTCSWHLRGKPVPHPSSLLMLGVESTNICILFTLLVLQFHCLQLMNKLDVYCFH